MTEAPILPTVFCFFAIFTLVMIVFLSSAIRVVPENRRLDVYRLGHYIGQKGPGLVVVLPIVDVTHWIEVDNSVTTGNDFQRVFGSTGEARTLVEQDGSVEVGGRVWSATSSQSILPGTRIRVKKVILEVEPLA
jgi:regulator of protease activity HflC (stomatin/prohibitin superfamily)